MSAFDKYQRVKILREGLQRVDEAYVVEFDDNGSPIVEYNHKFLKHMAVFKDEELEAYEQ